MSSTRIDVLCRPARPEDTPDVLELTKFIWNGQDYIPEVWTEWLADPQGQLLVADYKGKVLGISKLSQLDMSEWWMQGLRVHPQYEGKGIASQLTDATVKTWLKIGSGTVRLGTASFRIPVHHMCNRLGFTMVSERSSFYAPEKQGVLGVSPFHPVEIHQVDEAFRFAKSSASLKLTAGLIDLGWKFAPPGKKFIEEAIERDFAWWWRDQTGLVTAYIDEDDDLGRALAFELLACPVGLLSEILPDIRVLAGNLGYSQVAWMAPLYDSLLLLLETAGFKRVWENSLFIFAKTHPERPSYNPVNKI